MRTSSFRYCAAPGRESGTTSSLARASGQRPHVAWQLVRRREYSRKGPAGTVAVRDEALRVGSGNPAQQSRQASQFCELIPAVSAARQVSVDGFAVGFPDRAKDVDPQLEANLPACTGAGHGMPAHPTDQGVLQQRKERTETWRVSGGARISFLTRRQTRAARPDRDRDQ
jgi:hypothetical protein